MSITHKSKYKGIDYVAISLSGQEYLFSFDARTQHLALFKGPGLSAKFNELLSCEFDGCIECNLTISIKDAITKEGNEILELGITKADANEVISQINAELNEKFPPF